MVFQYIVFMTVVVLLAVLANYMRFRLSGILNKWALTLSTLGLVVLEGYALDFQHTTWLLLGFIGMSVLCFGVGGGLASSIAAWLFFSVQSHESDLSTLFTYLLFATGIHILLYHIGNLQNDRDDWLSKLTENSRQLNVFKEVSLSMQQTLNLDKLLKTILTSVTAGHGLGFNRAMILLMDEPGANLRGIMGTGPMSAEEGYSTWTRITKHRYKLQDLIEIKEKETASDVPLNEYVRRIEVPLDEPSFLSKALERGIPLHLREVGSRDRNRDPVLQRFADEFGMNELAVFPLISQGEKVGVLLIDNPVNKKPITPNDIDSVLPLANQAAIAIQHSRLYTKIEDMALKVGLTGLLNQRAFQSLLHRHWPAEGEPPLALILMDIDYFKHFNDTNGHLLGNEILMQLAEIIRHAIRKDDLAFRFGGEEFVVLLPGTEEQEAAMVAERIRESVESTAFPCGDKQPDGRVTVSLGVSSSGRLSSNTPFELVDTADQALYQAKAAGKNRVVI